MNPKATYEQQLDDDSRWALREGSLHFEKSGAVYKTLTKLAKNLDDLRIPYAIAGGMALFLHGYRRFTEDVDILVTQESLEKIHEHLDGLGYVRPFEGSKNLRDTHTGVRIDFLISGGFPGDGKPKAISFPDPQFASERIDDANVVSLKTLIELKLASGTHPGRFKDLGDVQEVIKELRLPRDFGQKIDPSVREMFEQLWDGAQMTEGNPEK